jgi:hypothetical protein
MPETTCPVCGLDVPVATVYLWPDGDTRLVSNHGTDTEAHCDGSLREVS